MTDCKQQFASGSIRLARTKAESSPAECAAVDYGDDSSEWANDGDCDDPRFIGEGAYSIMLKKDERADAADCRALCEAGSVWLK